MFLLQRNSAAGIPNNENNDNFRTSKKKNPQIKDKFTPSHFQSQFS